MKIAYLCSSTTLPNAATRHPGGGVHDAAAAQLRNALSTRGGSLDEVAWDDGEVDWADYDAVLIGSPWDYIGRVDEFLATLNGIESRAPLFNPMLFVEWNARKTYLRELSTLGIEVVSTIWLPEVSTAALAKAYDVAGNIEVVLKPQVGAGAHNQYRLKHGDRLPETARGAMMVQPFYPTIETEGEYSFVYIAGKLSHTVLKKAKVGDYRVQALYGGTEERITPSADDAAASARVLAVLETKPLYARVDMVRNPATGRLNLMEFEAIEPVLFPGLCDDLGEKLVDGLSKALLG